MSQPPVESSDPVRTVRVRLDPGWVRRSAAGVLVLLALFRCSSGRGRHWGASCSCCCWPGCSASRWTPSSPGCTNSGSGHAGWGRCSCSSCWRIFTAIFFLAFGQLFASQISALVQAAPGIMQSVIDWLNQRFNLGLDPTTIIDQLNLTPQNGRQDTRGRPPEACWGCSDRRSASSSKASRCCCSRSTSPPTAPGCAGTWPRCFPSTAGGVQQPLDDLHGEGRRIRDLPVGPGRDLGHLLRDLLHPDRTGLLVAAGSVDGADQPVHPNRRHVPGDRTARPDRDPVRPAAGCRVGDHLRHGLPAGGELLLRAEDQCQDHGHPSSRCLRIGHRGCRVVRTHRCSDRYPRWRPRSWPSPGSTPVATN